MKNRVQLRIFHRLTLKIPLLNRLQFIYRFIIIIGLIITIPITYIALQSKNTKAELLINNNWCVNKMYYNGLEIVPQTIGLLINFNANCNESITFNSNGAVSFPGINSVEFKANWKLEKDSLIITEINDENTIRLDKQLNVVYNKQNDHKYPYLGAFYCEIKNNILKIQNDSFLVFANAEQKPAVDYLEDEY